MMGYLKKLGPGFLFAGAAIGVSHLVQSTRAGADFGFGLLWALILINIVKYPFFKIGTYFPAVTGKTLLEGYASIHKGVLVAYFILTITTMFTIQTAVTIVTAGIAVSLFKVGTIVIWTAIITCICVVILVVGKYSLLDKMMKIIVLALTCSTLLAISIAFTNINSFSVTQIIPVNTIEWVFLITFMGWMPAPLDLSVWQSLWTIEKQKKSNSTKKQLLLDFNSGYITTTILAIAFLILGALVMYGSGTTFSTNGGEFANQLIALYTSNFGQGASLVIGIAALATMFSTSLTTLDASPRALQQTSVLLWNKQFQKGYVFWLTLLVVGTLIIFFFLASEMGLLIKIATIVSFVTAPFYAIFNYKLLVSNEISKKDQPSLGFKIYAKTSIVLLVLFSSWYVSTFF